MVKYWILLLLFLVSSCRGCIEISPSQTTVKGQRVNARGKICGEKLMLAYSQPINEIDIAIFSERNDCSWKRTFNGIKQVKLHILAEESCGANITLMNHTLHFDAVDSSAICIKYITVRSCSPKDNTNSNELKRSYILKRNIPGKDHPQSNKTTGLLLILLVSCGVFFVMVTSLVATLLSCCYKKGDGYKPTITAETKEFIVHESFSSSTSSTAGLLQYYSSRGQTSEPTNGFNPPPSSPLGFHLNASPSQPHYISPSLLNIPDIPPATPPTRSSKIHLSTENIADISVTAVQDEQHYHVLEEQHSQNDVEIPCVSVIPEYSSSGSRSPSIEQSSSREGTYFVLEITSSEQQDPSLVADDESATQTERIYHELEPLSSDSTTGQVCSLCNNPVPEEEESLYLVVLPEQTSLEQTEIGTDTSEPVYQILEQPSVICQSCLLAEVDPIYHEVGRSLDPVYERVKNLKHQGTSTFSDDSSHIYSTVHSLDLPIPVHNSDHVGSLNPFKRTYLNQIRMKSGSSDYASIPDDLPYHRQQLEAQATAVKDSHNLTHLVNTLKLKLAHRLRQRNKTKSLPVLDYSTSDTDPACVEPFESSCHHIYMNTSSTVDPRVTLAQVQMKLDGIKNMEEKRKTIATSSPSRNALARSFSQANSTPLIIAQKKKSGSYHVLTVEDIWQHQLANRYAPVSVITRRSPSPKKRASVKSRKSYIRDNLLDRPSSQLDYEVPVPFPHCVPPQSGAVIPPPSVLRANSRKLSRQNASIKEPKEPTLIEDDDEIDAGRLYTVSSEPCLSSIGGDYDYLESLSPMPSPSKSPLKKASSCSQSSPVKLLYLEKFVPLAVRDDVLSDDDDYYDHTWDTEETN